MYDLYNLCDRNLCVDGLFRLGESGVYRLRRWNIFQYDHQRSRMYGLCHLRGRNLSINGLYDDCQSCLYLVRCRVDLQYHHERGLVYGLCHCLRSRKYLSVHGLYRLRQPGLYSVYGLCGRNLQKHGLYGLGQHCVYVLCSGHDVQYDD